jgi:hypothetical protein
MRLLLDIGEEPGLVKVVRTVVKHRWKNLVLRRGAKRLNWKRLINVLINVIIMKRILLTIALLGVLGISSQANAGVHFGVGIGVGPGYYGAYPYYGYPYGYGPYYYPGPNIYVGPGYYPWYNGYWHGGYYRGRGFRGGHFHR